MEAVNCLKEKKRMCNTIGCSECGLSHFNNGHSILCHFFLEEFPEEAVRIVEEWSKAHPIQTNGQKFVEVFGTVKTRGLYTHDLDAEITAYAIDKSWWDAPYEAPKGADK